MKLIRNRLFLATICVILSALCVYSFLQSNISEDLTAYKLTYNVSKGTEITSDMLTPVTVGSKGMEDVITEQDEIIGRYSTYDLVKGQMIFDNSISETQKEVLQGFEKLDGEHFAYSITIKSLASSVTGKVQAGDVVSVYVNTNGESILPLELKYVEVLNASTSVGTEKTQNSEENISTVTFVVNETQAKLLNEYEYTSNLHLALVHRGEDEKKQEYLSLNHLTEEPTTVENGTDESQKIIEPQIDPQPVPQTEPTE